MTALAEHILIPPELWQGVFIALVTTIFGGVSGWLAGQRRARRAKELALEQKIIAMDTENRIAHGRIITELDWHKASILELREDLKRHIMRNGAHQHNGGEEIGAWRTRRTED